MQNRCVRTPGDKYEILGQSSKERYRKFEIDYALQWEPFLDFEQADLLLEDGY